MIGISKCRSVAEFARFEIQIYGFLPMQLPREMRFMDLIHAADERIPVGALRFATDAVFQVLQRQRPLTGSGRCLSTRPTYSPPPLPLAQRGAPQTTFGKRSLPTNLSSGLNAPRAAAPLLS